jgi:hypothetical protein
MGYNKVVINGQTKLDISDTEVVAADVKSGLHFYDRNGIKQVGTNENAWDFTAILNINTQNPGLYNRTITITKVG